MPQDRATRFWIVTALFVTLGLPLMLLALAVVYRAEILDAAVSAIPVAHEQALAEQFWRLQQRQLALIENTPANRFIAEVGSRLASAKPSPYAYRFHLADDASINAFALPAGLIVVHRGLIEKARSAEEVAGVLAHEIEHVEQRHGLRGMVQAIGFSALWWALTGDGGSLLGPALKELATLHFSREQETTADLGGFERLVAAGIAPQGMASFFEGLAADATMPGMVNLLSTHPASAQRAERLKALVESAPNLPLLAADWPQIRASIHARTQ